MENKGLVSYLAAFMETKLNVDEGFSLLIAAVAAIILTFVIILALIHFNRVFFRKFVRRNELHLKYAYSLLNFLIIIFGALLLGLFFGAGNSMARILLGSTGLVVAILGFAAQSALGDVIAGFMMGFCRPFRLGDRITLDESGISGTVRDMTIRHTVIHRFDGLYVIVPNSVMNKAVIHNNRYKGELTGSYLEFAISYGSDIRKAMRIIHNAVVSCRYAVEYVGDNPENKRAAVYVTDFGNSAVMLRTTVWARNSDENFLACSSIRETVKREFDRQGVEIPFNYLNVVMREQSVKDEDDVLRPVFDDDNIIVAAGDGNEGMKNVLSKVDSFCKRHKVSRKESTHLRILSEELVNIVQTEEGTFDGEFSIHLKGQVCEIHVKKEMVLDEAARKNLLAVSSSGRNMAEKGVMSTLRSVFEDYRLGVVSGGSGKWSLKSFEQKKGEAGQDEQYWEDLEKSIVAKFADDVQIGINNNKVDMVAYKKIWTAK